MQLGQFNNGDQVFVAQTPTDWIVVEVVEKFDRGGSVGVKVLWTAGLPGLVVGGQRLMAANIVAHRELTVSAVLGSSESASNEVAAAL